MRRKDVFESKAEYGFFNGPLLYSPVKAVPARRHCEVHLVLHFLVQGRVQGVGFRWFVHREASNLDLRGWVRNTEEGEVEVLAAGSADDLDALRSILHRGPRGCRVDHVQEHQLAQSEAEGLSSFRIDGAW